MSSVRTGKPKRAGVSASWCPGLVGSGSLVPIAHLWQSRVQTAPEVCYGIGTRPFGSPPAPHVKTNEFAGSDGGEAVSRLAAAWASAFSFQVNVLDTGDPTPRFIL